MTSRHKAIASRHETPNTRLKIDAQMSQQKPDDSDDDYPDRRCFAMEASAMASRHETRNTKPTIEAQMSRHKLDDSDDDYPDRRRFAMEPCGYNPVFTRRHEDKDPRSGVAAVGFLQQAKTVKVYSDQIFFPTCAIDEDLKAFAKSTTDRDSSFTMKLACAPEDSVGEGYAVTTKRRLTIRAVLEALSKAGVLSSDELRHLIDERSGPRWQLGEPLRSSAIEEINECISQCGKTLRTNSRNDKSTPVDPARAASQLVASNESPQRSRYARHEIDQGFDRTTNLISRDNARLADSRNHELPQQESNGRHIQVSNQRPTQVSTSMTCKPSISDTAVDGAKCISQLERLEQVCLRQLKRPRLDTGDEKRLAATLRTLDLKNRVRGALSDADVQEYVKMNRTAVDVVVDTCEGDVEVVARIDGMSAGCFVSPRFVSKYNIPVDTIADSPSFICPKGIMRTRGTADLALSWKSKDGTRIAFSIRFNVPEVWGLDIDLLVTVPMAKRTGMKLVAYGVNSGDTVAPIYDRCYGSVFFVRSDRSQRDQDSSANDATRAMNRLYEQWLSQQPQQGFESWLRQQSPKMYEVWLRQRRQQPQ